MSREGESLRPLGTKQTAVEDGCRVVIGNCFAPIFFETRDTRKRALGALSFEQLQCYSLGSNFAIPISRGLIDFYGKGFST